MKKINNRIITIFTLALITTISCTREFTPLPEANENHLDPNEQKLVFQNDSTIVVKINEYIDALEFSLASQEIKELSNEKVRDSIQSIIEESEAFADNFLLFTLNDIGKKEYIYGKERIPFFRKHGYLDYVSEAKSIRIEKVTKDDVVAFFNFQAFPNVREVSMKCANADYIDFSGLNSVESFFISNARNNTTLDFENLKQDHVYITLTATPNVKLKINKKTKLSFGISNSKIKSLSEIGIKNLKQLTITNTKLVDNKILKELNPDIEKLDIQFGGNPETDEEGLTYYSPVLDDNFVNSVSNYAPNMKRIYLKFNNIKEFNKVSFDKIANIKLPLLNEIYFYTKGESSNISKSEWKKQTIINLPHCPNLKEFNINGKNGGVYTHTLDLSRLNKQQNPNLTKLEIRGYFEKLILPKNSNEIKLKLKVRGLKEVIIPEEAVGNQSIEFEDYNEVFKIDRETSLDWDDLRKKLKSVKGYLNITPPSSYIPYNKKDTIYFSHPRLDFNNKQWKDFEGKISFSLGKNNYGNINFKYINFGHLTAKNLLNKRIKINEKCVVKNIPHGIMIVRK